MTKKWKIAGVAVAFLLTLPATRSCAGDTDAPGNADDQLKALAEAAKPGPEHAKLQPLVGAWTYKCKLWMDPRKPPVVTTGTIERKWILGGRFLEEKVAGTGFDGKPGFEGLGLLGFDNGRKKYTYTWACTMGTGTSNGVGVSESPGTFTFKTTCYCPVMKKTLRGRDELRIVNANKVIVESYMVHEGQEMKVMEIVSIRSK